MNDKIKNKARLLVACMGAHSSAPRAAVTEAIGYVLAFEEALPSSEMRVAMLSNQLVESQFIASEIGENTMLLATDIHAHTARFYELRHAAAFSGLLMAASMAGHKVEFKNEETPRLVGSFIRELTKQGSVTSTAQAAM